MINLIQEPTSGWKRLFCAYLTKPLNAAIMLGKIGIRRLFCTRINAGC